MKSTLLVVPVALLSGFAGAWLASALRASEAPRREARSTPVGPLRTSGDEDGQARELDALRLELQAQLARIEALEQRPEPAARVALEDALPAPSAELALGPESAASPAWAAAALPDTVRTALEEIRAEERAAQEREREQREAQRREERLVRLQKELGLSNVQVADLRTWMIDARAAREELERQREAGGDRETFRSVRAELRTRDQASLQRILSPAQYQAWQEREAREDERGRRSERDGQRDKG